MICANRASTTVRASAEIRHLACVFGQRIFAIVGSTPCVDRLLMRSTHGVDPTLETQLQSVFHDLYSPNNVLACVYYLL